MEFVLINASSYNAWRYANGKRLEVDKKDTKSKDYTIGYRVPQTEHNNEIIEFLSCHGFEDAIHYYHQGVLSIEFEMTKPLTMNNNIAEFYLKSSDYL